MQSRTKNLVRSAVAALEFHYFEGLDHSLNIVPYFVTGELPKGHQAMFQFIDRIAPPPAGN